jgi:hypothetical protein
MGSMKKNVLKKHIFDTDRRIRLGIWGLGRGMSFYRMCQHLNMNVVAGCDYNEHMRQGFLAANPGAFVTADADEFLKQDFDAVLLATFCPAHAGDAIRCLRAGKHVLSEVTAFHTMAEGVALVEEVEKAGKVYNLAENYPFTAANSYLARKWKEGLFGELLYAEYEYVHECRALQYTYIDGVPVQPGHALHNWRSWLNGHYYCTHSLGPVMVITGLRPVQVVALPSTPAMAGYIKPPADAAQGRAISVSPSLIRMSNGAVIRNLMGATTNDTHVQRIWGTLGAAELNVGKELQLRLGGAGAAPKAQVIPRWDGLGELAAQTGHGGGDFWILYYFARQILTGEPAPFDIYSAADVTIPGILAMRSAVEGGKPYDVPDFRDKAHREAWRNDRWAQTRIDPKSHAFGTGADPAATADFSRTIAELVRFAPQVRAYADWSKVAADMADPPELLTMAEQVVSQYPAILDAYRRGRRIADAFPGSEAARVLSEMLAVGLVEEVLSPSHLPRLKRELAGLKRKYALRFLYIEDVRASAMLPKPKTLAAATKPGRALRFPHAAEYSPSNRMWFVRNVHQNKLDGLIYIRGALHLPAAGNGELLYGSDGPVRVWVNGRPAGCQPKATNPIISDQYRAAVNWKKGKNEVVFAFNTNNGRAWGVCARGVTAS